MSDVMRSAETVRPEQGRRRSTFGVRVRARTTSGYVALAPSVPVSIVVTREILNRSLANRQIFDWLDETLGLGRGSERPQAG
jgi:ribosomal protein L34